MRLTRLGEPGFQMMNKTKLGAKPRYWANGLVKCTPISSEVSR